MANTTKQWVGDGEKVEWIAMPIYRSN